MKIDGMLSSTPRSFLIIGLTALVYLLQLPAIPGLFLLIFQAQFWTVLTINLGILCLGVEALTGRLHKTWLIVPLVWCAGYECAAWESHRNIRPLQNEIVRSNDKQQIAFDPNEQSLVIEDSVDFWTARRLLEGYNLSVIYMAQAGSHEPQYTAYRISRTESCDAIDKSNRFDQPVHGSVLEVGSPPYTEHLLSSCFFGLQEMPPSSKVVISLAKGKRQDEWPLSYSSDTIRIASDDRKVELRNLTAAPLTWYPAPTMGCSFNSGGPSWHCSPDFIRDVVNVADTTEVIAKALRLKAVAPLTAEFIRQRKIELDDSSKTSFKEFVADNSKPITAADLRAIAKDPAQYSNRAADIALAIGRALSQPEPRFDIAANLGEILASLPDDQFQAIVPQLLQSYSAAKEINTSVIWDQMANRLSALGAPALPVLERLAFEEPDSLTRPIYALCRLGSVASRDGEKLAKYIQSTKRSDDQHIAVFKTLLRIGRSDLLNGESDANSQFMSDEYRWWRWTIMPFRSASVCSRS